MAGAGLNPWHIITSEYPPDRGGVSDYTAQLALALEAAGQPVRVWCREFQGFTPQGLAAVGRELDRQPGRILLQWVPHGFGYRSMNVGFCRWIASRPELLDIMVHEPGLGFGEGGMRHNAVAAIHRLMAAILLRRARHVWVAIPAWEDRLRPYALGRRTPFTWLPVPSNIALATTCASRTHPFGYFGPYDKRNSFLLRALLDCVSQPVFLIGRGGEQIRHANARPAGELTPEALSRAIQSCELMIHTYPDGVSTRRGTVMASLAHGSAIVANEGKYTESVWRESGAIELAANPEDIAHSLAALLADPQRLQELRQKAHTLYRERFAIENTVHKLKSSLR